MIYVASPYSNGDRQQNFEMVEAYVAEQAKLGICIYSPIVHFRALAEKYNLPTDFDFWKNHCLNALDACCEMHILMLPGWETSVGIANEILHCRETNKTIKKVTL